MAAEARRLAPDLSWAAVAGRYDRASPDRAASHGTPRRSERHERCTFPEPSFDHLLAMSDDIGIFEHADHAAAPARARLLHRRHGPPAHRRGPRAAPATRSVRARTHGDALPRRGPGRRRPHRATAAPPAAAGTAGAASRTAGAAACGRSAPRPGSRRTTGCGRARSPHFDHGVAQRSPHRRAMAFAALGAAEVLATRSATQPGPGLAGRRGRQHRRRTARPAAGRGPRRACRYANAVLAEVLIAGGHLLQRPSVLDDGLRLLGWLLDRETLDGHLSPTPVGGSGPGDRAPDVRPATHRGRGHGRRLRPGRRHHGRRRLERGLERCIDWFAGRQRSRRRRCGTRRPGAATTA